MPEKREDRAGLLITFEGIEGSGKSTQIRMLAARLRQDGYPVLETREPGGTPSAERIRSIFLPDEYTDPLDTLSELFLVLAARRQHLRHAIQPALRAGYLVLCDRFSDSTLAYQRYGRGLDLHLVEHLNALVTEGRSPDLTLWLDVPVAIGLARRHTQGQPNRIDRETVAFHERVRHGFLSLHRRGPARLKRLDGQQHPDRIAEDVWQVVHEVLAAR